MVLIMHHQLELQEREKMFGYHLLFQEILDYFYNTSNGDVPTQSHKCNQISINKLFIPACKTVKSLINGL